MKAITIIIFAIITTIFSYSQDYSNVALVFNDSLPASSIYKLQDILDTDTIKTNDPNIVIVGFTCSSICSIDWEVKHKSNILSSTAKKYIKSCAKGNSKLYFDNIRARNKNGIIISLGSRAIRLL